MSKRTLYLAAASSLLLLAGCASEEDVLAEKTFRAKEYFQHVNNCREQCGGEALEPINYPADLTELSLLISDLQSKGNLCIKFCQKCPANAAAAASDGVAESAALGALGGVIAGEVVGAGARALLK